MGSTASIGQIRWRALLATAALLLMGPASTAFAQQTVSARLAPVGGSGVSGTAQLTASEQRTEVTVELRGLAPGSRQVSHLHSGSCAQPGGVVFMLTDVVADAEGRAVSRTTLAAPLSSVLAGPVHLDVHAGQILPAPTAACGDLPARATVSGTPAAPFPVQLPRTGTTGLDPKGLMAAGVLLSLAGALVRRLRHQSGLPTNH